jgi:hypothetical protein
MGKKPAELEREIREHRAAIDRKIAALDDRVRTDVKDAGASLSSRIEERAHVKQYAEERPLATVLGAFGTGVALGMVSNRRGHSPTRRNAYDWGNGRNRGGMFDELLGAASGAIGTSMRGEVRDLVRQIFGADQPSDADREFARAAVDRDAGQPDTRI